MGQWMAVIQTSRGQQSYTCLKLNQEPEGIKVIVQPLPWELDIRKPKIARVREWLYFCYPFSFFKVRPVMKAVHPAWPNFLCE